MQCPSLPHFSSALSVNLKATSIKPTDLLVGQRRRFCVQPCSQKYFVSPFGRNSFIDSSSRPSEGRFVVVTNAGRDAVDMAVSLTNGTQADGRR
jgi:hypothetical protein